jgi:hypothetical protein
MANRWDRTGLLPPIPGRLADQPRENGREVRLAFEADLKRDFDQWQRRGGE